MWTFRSVPFGPLCLSALTLSLSGCKEDLLGTPRITVNRQNVEFLWDGVDADTDGTSSYYSPKTTAEIQVNSSTSYTYTCDASWVHISFNDRYSKMEISSDVNAQRTTRSATIHLTTAPNGRGVQGQQTIQISQQGFGNATLVSPSSLTLEADDTNPHPVTIDYDGYFQTSCDCDWLVCSPSRGSSSSTSSTKYSSSTFSIYAKQPNLGTSARQGKVTLTLSRLSGSAKYTTTILVTQQGAAHGLLEETVIELSSEAVSDRSVTVNYSGSWRATSDAGWLNARKKYNSSNDGGYFLVLSAEANLSVQPRTATVTVTTTDLSGGQYQETIQVTQQGAP